MSLKMLQIAVEQAVVSEGEEVRTGGLYVLAEDGSGARTLWWRRSTWEGDWIELDGPPSTVAKSEPEAWRANLERFRSLAAAAEAGDPRAMRQLAEASSKLIAAALKR